MAVALKRPGMARAFLGLVVGFAFGYGLVVALRAISGEPSPTAPLAEPTLVVRASTAPPT